MPKDGPEKSFPFLIAEWKVQRNATYPKNALHRESNRLLPVENKWVYVFADLGSAIIVKYEVWVDSDWERWVSDKGQVKTPVHLRADPDHEGGATKGLALPAMIDGRRPRYHFLVSRIRLSLPILQALAPLVRRYIPVAAEKTKDGWIYNYSIVKGIGGIWLPGTDPLTVAENIAKAYRKNLSDQADFLAREAKKKKEVEKERFTRELFELLRNSKELYDHVEDNLRYEYHAVPAFLKDQEKLATMYNYLRSKNRLRQTYTAKVEGKALRLCLWLSCDFFEIFAEGYRLNEKDPYEERAEAEHLLDFYAEILDGLDQSFAGYLFLEKWCKACHEDEFKPRVIDEKLGHILSAFVFRNDVSGTEAFRIMRFAAKSIAAIANQVAVAWVATIRYIKWNEIVTSIRKLAEEKILVTVSTELRWAKTGFFGLEFDVELKKLYRLTEPLQPSSSLSHLSHLERSIYIKKDTPQGEQIRMWLEGDIGPSVSPNKVEEVTAHLGRALDALNIAIAIRQVAEELDKGGSLASKPTADLLAFSYALTTNELARSFGKAEKKWLEAFTKRLGVVGSIYFICGNMHALADATASGNRAKAGALAFATGGEIISALAAIGAFGAMSGFGAGVGLAIAGIGYVIAALSEPDALETFVARCAWGDEWWESPNEPWVPGGSVWKEDYEAQRHALHNILYSFSGRGGIMVETIPACVCLYFRSPTTQTTVIHHWFWQYTKDDELDDDLWTLWPSELRTMLRVDEDGQTVIYIKPPAQVTDWMWNHESFWGGPSWPYKLWVQLYLEPLGGSEKPTFRIPGKKDLAVQLSDEGSPVQEREYSLNIPH